MEVRESRQRFRISLIVDAYADDITEARQLAVNAKRHLTRLKHPTTQARAIDADVIEVKEVR